MTSHSNSLGDHETKQHHAIIGFVFVYEMRLFAEGASSDVTVRHCLDYLNDISDSEVLLIYNLIIDGPSSSP